MFIDCIIIILICILTYLIIMRLYNTKNISQEKNVETYVTIKTENITPPPYNDVFLMENEKERYDNKNKFEEDLTLNYYQEPVIEDIPINIIYDKLTN